MLFLTFVFLIGTNMLSKRLTAVLNYIDSNAILADIGCDHGYLSIEAIKKGCKMVQLVDNKKMPLEVARRNFSEFNHTSEVIYTLADGLSNIDSRINTVAICGMGGDLIARIIADNIEVARRMDSLVLEPNSKEFNLRQFLNDNNFEIIDEDIVYEKDKYYVIIKCKYQIACEKLNYKELLYGKFLINKNTSVFNDYLNTKLQMFNKIIKNNLNDDEYKKNILLQKQLLEEILNETNRIN